VKSKLVRQFLRKLRTTDKQILWIYNIDEVVGVAFSTPSGGYTLSKIIEFDFKDGDVLMLREYYAGILFNNFHVVNCGQSVH